MQKSEGKVYPGRFAVHLQRAVPLPLVLDERMPSERGMKENE
jgi:hypothetical protein